MEVNGRCTYMYLNIYGVAPKNQIQLHFRGIPIQVFSIPAGVPRHTFPPPWEPRSISFHPRGIPADSAGFPWSPDPVQVSSVRLHLLLPSQINGPFPGEPQLASSPSVFFFTYSGQEPFVHHVSEKNCANFFLSELRQMSTNFGTFWQKDGKEAKIMQGALNFHLT